MNMRLNGVLLGFVIGFVIYTSIKMYVDILRPYYVKKKTKEIEKNPKWLTPVLRAQYYGLDDVDIIIAENKYGVIPHFRTNIVKKDKNKHIMEVRLELVLPIDVSTNDLDTIARIALLGKICVKVGTEVGMLYANKPPYWLSILNYMLDGGTINQSAISWKNKSENK